MRQTIRQLLIDGVPQAEGRVYDPYAADGQTLKPFLVLTRGSGEPEVPQPPWRGATAVFMVSPHVARTAVADLDTISAAVVSTLHRTMMRADGVPYLLEHLGRAGSETLDATLDTLTAGLRFAAHALNWSGGSTFDPDPVTALRSWSAEQFPAAQTDPATWDPADAAPGIYWRLGAVTPVSRAPRLTWVDMRIHGHVLAPSPSVTADWVRRVVERLSLAGRVTMSDGGPLLVQSVSAEMDADAVRAGQLLLTARLGVLAPGPTDPVLDRAIIQGSVSGEVNRRNG